MATSGRAKGLIKEKSGRTRVIIAVLTVLILALVLYGLLIRPYMEKSKLTVGFIYDNESDTPYSYNFFLAQEAIQKEYEGKVKVMMYSNVLEESLGDRMEELAKKGCEIIFTNGYGQIRKLAKKYPDIQFCQASNDSYPDNEALKNYHTFKGEVYQGRYVSGVVAGIKLKEMIDTKEIKPSQAKVGFVGAFPYTEVISGYTAFLLGVRSVVPQTTMEVRYTNTWDSYTQEKARATQLLDDGCMIISQHTDTVGPAIACEEYLDHRVYHVGYNIDMTDVAPKTSLVSTRINWEPYVMGAVGAMLDGKRIEEAVQGRVHPKNDMSAGFDEGWVDMLKLNTKILPKGTKKKMENVIKNIEDGKITVFKGKYTGAWHDDRKKKIDLTDGFIENEDSSIPSFGYVLDDVIKEK